MIISISIIIISSSSSSISSISISISISSSSSSSSSSSRKAPRSRARSRGAPRGVAPGLYTWGSIRLLSNYESIGYNIYIYRERERIDMYIDIYIYICREI